MSGLPRGAAPGLPAWKRALLERKRAKLAVGVELQRGPAPRPGLGPGSEGLAERAVVAESLGPLRENPFIRLEGERRRRRRGASEAAVAPSLPAESPALSQLLELYGSMPGIRTIRADNILIIESRDGDGDSAAAAAAPSPRQGGDSGVAGAPGRPGAGTPSRGRLSRGCSPVTEIRAAEVVVYEAAGRPPAAEPEAGRVSRLLQKFDRRPRESAAKGKLAPPLPGDLLRKPPAAPSPATTAACPGPLHSRRVNAGNFVHKTSSNSFVVTPRGRCPGSATGAAAPVLSSNPTELEEAGFPSRYQGQGPPVAVPSSATLAALPPLHANSRKPKPESAALAALPQSLPRSSASPASSTSASSHQPRLLVSSSCAFEIRPAPKPDLAAIPAHDLQAHALASLRLNSRNSFLFVPHQKGKALGPPEPAETLSAEPGGALAAAPVKPAEALVPVTYIDEDLVALVPGHMPPLKVLSPRLEGFDVPPEGILAFEMEDSYLPTDGSHSTGSVSLFKKSTNTLTVMPQRKPLPASLGTSSQTWLQEEEEGKEGGQPKGKTEALHEEPGPLKKRYPTVNEIEVIGGYLSLDKSCMSKSGVQRKKMKISFNESSLQTMFEYPSEGSLVEEEEEYATEVDKILASFIPQPNSTENSTTISSGLSSYTPKHSLEFSKWQEKQSEDLPPSIGNFPQDADLPCSQAMLTPGETSIPCDFSSEPALFF